MGEETGDGTALGGARGAEPVGGPANHLHVPAPALSHATDAVVYTGPPTAPALHISAPAQHPRLKLVRVSGLVFVPFTIILELLKIHPNRTIFL